MNVIEKARLFATAAHKAAGNKRKYTGEDYIVHPAEVASIVSSIGGDAAIQAAAWLHDVVEDTHVDLELIEQEFGMNITLMVRGMTDVSKPYDGNRAVRKTIDRNHLAECGYEIQTIKLADIISNTSSIVEHDQEFAKIYLPEKVALLDVLTRGNTCLHARARAIVERSMRTIYGEDV